MAITKTTTTSIKDASVEEANINNCAATNTKLGADAVTSAKINNGTVTTDDLASTLDLSSKTVTLPDGTISFDREYNNIGLLGFKMAVNESLTVFNLVDGVVDEFNDESGTDEAEGSNDLYCGTSDFYSNQQPLCYSAGFSTTAITEPDTSVAGTNPTVASGTFGSFTVPTGITSVSVKAWGGGGRAPQNSPAVTLLGGGGGFVTGCLSVTPGQTLYVGVGEGGQTTGGLKGGGNGNGSGGGGGGFGGIFANTSPNISGPAPTVTPQIYFLAAGGGGAGNGPGGTAYAGAGGGTTGEAGLDAGAQTSAVPDGSGGAGSQTVGGQGGSPGGQTGSFLTGGSGANSGGGGGAGYYGGGGSGDGQSGGGGGSSYIGNPNVSCGSTQIGNVPTSGGASDPDYPADGNPVMARGGVSTTAIICGQDGYTLLTASTTQAASTTIVSSSFNSTSVPTSSRIVVFEENIDTPTLNTDIIASVSRDGGSNYTNATLSDSGYVTGSSGQRILTGQADISGQPSGQSMRWKLQLANNQVKIHGVSLSWA